MPKKVKQSKDIQFQLRAIELLDCSINYPPEDKLKTNQFNFNINIEHKINREKKLVFVITSVNILHEDKKTNLGNLKASCHFEISNLDEFFVTGQPDKINFPTNTIDSLNSISLSTIRGIMFSQFKGTFLHNAVLPVIDPKVFKPEPKKV